MMSLKEWVELAKERDLRELLSDPEPIQISYSGVLEKKFLLESFTLMGKEPVECKHCEGYGQVDGVDCPHCDGLGENLVSPNFKHLPKIN